MPHPLLEPSEMTIRFGGLVSLDQVALEVPRSCGEGSGLGEEVADST